MVKPDPIDELFAVSPRDFVQRRNAIASALRDTGHPAQAREVMRLRRPPLPVWLANHVARDDAEGVTRFIKAVAQLRRAHLGDGDLVTAMEQQRHALEPLVARARVALEEAGMAATPATMERMSATLLGAAANKAQQADLMRGRLSHESEAVGFDVFAGAAVRAPRKPIRARVKSPGHPVKEQVGSAPRTQGRRDTNREAAAEAGARKAAARTAQRVLALKRTAARHRAASAKAAGRAEALRARLARVEEHITRASAAAEAAEREAAAIADAEKRPRTAK